MRFSGPVELAAVGVSIAVFNQISKITIFPLVSITTSFVAEEDTIGRISVKSEENAILENGFAVKEMELVMEPLMKHGIFLTPFLPSHPQNRVILTIIIGSNGKPVSINMY